MENKILWYEKPAEKWKEALPIGNGRLGGMIYGEVDMENIQLNEDSVWYGGPRNRINPDALPNLEKIRNYIMQGKIKEAEELTLYALSGMPESQRGYLPLGNIYMRFIYDESNPILTSPLWFKTSFSVTETRGYQRTLNLEHAVSEVSYKVENTEYQRTHFVSYPDQVMVIHLVADGEKKINLNCYLDRFRSMDKSWKQDDVTIAYNGNTGEDGIEFCGMLRGCVMDGSCEVIGEHLIIRNASEATLLFTAATSYRFKNLEHTCIDILDKAEALGYDSLLERHIKDYTELFDKLELKLKVNNPELNQLSTDKRLNRLEQGEEDVGLMELYFNYGRYLLISSSRKGTLPANLQGIWNQDYFNSLADSKFTININTQMNYWAAEMGNLSECQMPLFDLMTRLHETGVETAKKMYGCNGFVAHHNTDIYADSAPQDKCISATYWVMGGAWLAKHIWLHYEYTKDLEFLKQYFYIIRDAVRFFNDFLIENEDGYYVTVPTLSPENTYIMENGIEGCLCAGCAMDNQILTDLYQAYQEGCKVLKQGEDQDVLPKAQDIASHICPPKIGKYGQIMEWMKDYDEKEPGHRHISQLYGVYPGEQITYEDTPKLMEAAKNTLIRRLKYGGGHTGWSRAWIINLWARFREGEKAYQNYLELLKGSTFPNLMDSHPYINEDGAAFQIDGNLGAVSGILQFFVQNYNRKVVLLPALPKAFSEGEIQGIRLKGNATCNISWKDGKLVTITIAAEDDYQSSICYKSKSRKVFLEKGEIQTFDGHLEIVNV